MRLSDIKGDRVFDVIADIAAPVYSIATDPAASELFKKADLKDGEDARDKALERLKDALPALLKGHKDDVCMIIATIEGIDPTEYRENVTMAGLFKGIYEMLTDEDLLSFLS